MKVGLVSAGQLVDNLRPLNPGRKTLVLFVQELCNLSWRLHQTRESIELDGLVVDYFYNRLFEFRSQGSIPAHEVNAVMAELGKWLMAIVDCSDPDAYAAICQRDERYCVAA
jgi:hypothetical protein